MDSFDFVVVGAGPAGCLLASRLAKELPQYKVLLVDAGGKNDDVGHQTYGERYWTLATAPGYNWGYKTVPQAQLAGRPIDYSRGKGLGGSTAINFCVYTRGSTADYDQWAELVGDDCWRWKETQGRFNKIERFNRPSSLLKEFCDISDPAHGSDGQLDVGFIENWDPELGGFLQQLYQYHHRNLDHNSGNPLGVAVCQVSASKGYRSTASGAYLYNAPSNLTIATEIAVTRVLFEAQKAVGIEVPGKTIYATKEVILSAGAIDSPKLLLLSGVGPREELQRHSIPIIKELPGIGRNLHDHLFLPLATLQKPGGYHRSTYLNSPEAQEEARQQWKIDQTGPISSYHLPQLIGHFKSNAILGSKEFRNLDPSEQKLLQAETKPCYEIFLPISFPGVKAPEHYLGTAVAFDGNRGDGEISLRSSDSCDSPIINPKFLSHPFDRRVAIEAVRETLKILETPSIVKDQGNFIAGPPQRDDDSILEYISKTATSMWHMCGTAKMGKLGEPKTCVDHQFRVVGLEALRVVDLSVAPLLPSAHTQAVAYLVGETAADKITAEYT